MEIANETSSRWFKRGTFSSATLRIMAARLDWTNLLLLATSLNRNRIQVIGKIAGIVSRGRFSVPLVGREVYELC